MNQCQKAILYLVDVLFHLLTPVSSRLSVACGVMQHLLLSFGRKVAIKARQSVVHRVS